MTAADSTIKPAQGTPDGRRQRPGESQRRRQRSLVIASLMRCPGLTDHGGGRLRWVSPWTEHGGGG